MENLLLIQPHSDDIMFSASHFLFNKKKNQKITILTIEYNEKRLQEDLDICKIFNVDLISLKSRVDSSNYHKEYYSKHSKMDDKTALKFCTSKIGKDNLFDLWDEINSVIKKYKKDGYKVVTCLGVGHPFHWITRIMTEEYADLYYRDFPHSYKRRNQEYINGLVNSKFKISFLSSPEKDHDEKIRIISKHYKSQSSLMFFEQRYINKRLPEEFYEKVKN
jgi:hypothetical protein